MKTKQVNIRLTEQQLKDLEKIAKSIGLNKSEYIRMLIIDNIREVKK